MPLKSELINLNRFPAERPAKRIDSALSYRESGFPRERRLILRRDPSGSLIDTDRRIEFAAYKAFFATEVPVPEVLWLENDSAHLGSPFFIGVEMTGFQTSPVRILMEPYASHHAAFRLLLSEIRWPQR